MLSRRLVLGLLGGAATSALVRPTSAATPELTEDGLYREPWFIESLLELADDVAEATGRGKRFAISWELKGCPACKEMHLVTFADSRVRAVMMDRFEVLQLNIIGAKRVTDFDGEELGEKALAKKYGVTTTPTIQFLPELIDGLAGKAPAEREVARLQGFMKPEQFLKVLRYVESRAYEGMSLRDYLDKPQG